METWKLFFSMAVEPVKFDFRDVEVTVGGEVGFATAIGSCCYNDNGVATPLDFRLTMGFRKIDGQWRIVHEHHSVPAGS